LAGSRDGIGPEDVARVRRASQGKPGKHAAIQSKGNSGDSSKHGNAECPSNPLLNPKSTLHCRKQTATGQQRNRQRRRGSGCVTQQEDGRMSTRALQGGSGKNKT
jgi:hypothetical protein